MPIPNFDFPGVTLTQHFESSTSTYVSDMSVVCVGQQYKVHKADDVSRDALVDQSLKAYSSANGLSDVMLPGVIVAANVDKTEETQRMVIKNGIFSYFTTTSDKAPTVAVATNELKFAYAVCDGYGHEAPASFIARGVQKGDPIIINKIKTGTDGETSIEETVVTSVIGIEGTTTLGNNIVRVASLGTITDSDTVSVSFCVKSAEAVPVGRPFSIDATSGMLTIQAGVQVELLSLSDRLFNLEQGDIYIEYRELMYDFKGRLGSVGSMEDIVNNVGAPNKNNPLALALYFALAAANGNIVYFTGVASDDVEGYTKALDFLEKYDNIYSVVVTSTDKNVIQACTAAVENASEDEESKVRRTLWYGIDTKEALVLEESEAIVAAGESTSEVTFGNPIFVDITIKAGDVLVDVAGKEYAVKSAKGLYTVVVDGKIEGERAAKQFKYVRKNPSNYELVQDIISSRSNASYRAQCVWGDDVLFNGEYVSNVALAAAAAGMRSGEPCHRPISNLSYSFFGLAESHGFTRSELREIGSNGIWIVGNNNNGTPSNLRQVTSAASGDVNRDEESIIANVDNIAITISHTGEDMVGNSNINAELLNVLRLRLELILKNKSTNLSNNVYVGPQLLSYSIDNIYQDPVNRDHIYAQFTIEPPKPFNKFIMTMRVI